MPLLKFSTVLHCDRQRAYDQWLQVVWRQGGGLPPCVVLEPGDPITGAGSVRRMSGCIKERILEAERPSRVVYTFVSGPFPIKNHRGEVTFHAPTATSVADSTVLEWQVQYTPTFWGTDWLLYAIMCSVFNWMLFILAREVEAALPSRK